MSDLKDDSSPEDSDDRVAIDCDDPDLLAAVSKLLQSQTFGDKQALFQAHPNLLTPEAARLLEQIEEIHNKRGDERSVQGTRWVRELVEHAISRGVEAAFLRLLVFEAIDRAPFDFDEAREYFTRVGKRFPELLRAEADAVLQELAEQQNEGAEDASNLYAFIRHALQRQRTTDNVRPATEAQRVGALVVANNLIRAYETGGDVEKLNRAVRVLRRALGQGSPAGPWLDVLGIALKLRYQITRNVRDIEDALAAHARLQALEPIDSQARRNYEDHYATTLRSHFIASGDRASLDEAVRIIESIVHSFEHDALDSILSMTNLGNVLLERFQARNESADLSDLEQAIGWYRRVRELRGPQLPDAAADGCHALLRLGLLTNDSALIDEARAWFKDAERDVQHSPHRRFTLGLNWTSTAFQGGLFAESVAGYRAALEGVQHLVFRAEELESSKRDWLRDFQWMVAQGAFASARLGKLDDAVVALESGLNLLLADRRMRLQQSAAGEAAARASIREVTIRDVCERLGDTMAAAYIVPSPAGGVILFVHRGAVSALWCPALDSESLKGRLLDREGKLLKQTGHRPDTLDALEADGYIGALARWRTDVEQGIVDDAVVSEWDDALRDTCQWLWDVAIGELAQLVQSFGNLELLLIPVGRLSGLPLHAAFGSLPQDETDAAAMLIDVADVCYAPSITVLPMLGSVRRGKPSVAAVADTKTLEYAGLESELVIRTIGAGATLIDNDVDALRALLRAHPIWHFACHSDVDMAVAESGYLLLENGTRVKVEVLLDGLDAQPELVNLAACTTGAANLKLLTESINLASDFVGHGARHILASSWPVDDAASCVFMIKLYDALPHLQWNAARALCHTQRWARDSSKAEKVAYLRSRMGGSIDAVEKIFALADALELDPDRPAANFKWWAAFFAVG